MKSLVDNCYRWKSIASVAFPAMRPNETTPHSPLYHPFISPSFRISRFRPAEHNDESTYKVFFKHDLTNNFSYIYVEPLFLSLNKNWIVWLVYILIIPLLLQLLYRCQSQTHSHSRILVDELKIIRAFRFVRKMFRVNFIRKVKDSISFVRGGQCVLSSVTELPVSPICDVDYRPATYRSYKSTGPSLLHRERELFN